MKDYDYKEVEFNQLAIEYYKAKNEGMLEKYELTGNKDNFYNRNDLSNKSTWLLPQITAFLASFKLPRNKAGKIDGSRFWGDNVDMKDKWNVGLKVYVTTKSRSLIVDKQTKGDDTRYASLVPIVLAAHKEFNDIPYSDWDKETLGLVVDPLLLEAMLAINIPEFTQEQLLGYRENALVVSSITAKRKRNIITAVHTPRGYKGTLFYKLPRYIKVMLIQSWVAHQTIRNKYMVLDHLNWDSMPEPIISEDIL